MCFYCDDPVPDPISGDPATVARFARAFLDTAEALRDAAKELRTLANENVTISLAIDEVRDKADQVSGDTGKVAQRYEGAGNTFASYASALESARTSGNGARSNIIANNDDGRYWRHRERELRQQTAYGSADPQVLEDLQTAVRRANYYDGLYSGYAGAHSSAVRSKDDAVTAAINGLADAEQAAGLNDGFFDGIWGDFQLLWEVISKYVGPALEVFRDFLKIVKQIVDVLALIVGVLSIFLPFLGPLALALTALGAILAIVIFISSALLFLMGRETLGTVLADGISMVTSIVTARFAGATSLFGAVKGGAATFTQVAAKIADPKNVTLAVNTTAAAIKAAAAEEAGKALVPSIISSNTAPISFVVGEGLDFTLGGSGPAWDMSGADGLSLLPGLGDIATLGVATPTATLVDMITQGISLDVQSEDFANSWGAIGAVPAT